MSYIVLQYRIAEKTIEEFGESRLPMDGSAWDLKVSQADSLDQNHSLLVIGKAFLASRREMGIIWSILLISRVWICRNFVKSSRCNFCN